MDLKGQNTDPTRDWREHIGNCVHENRLGTSVYNNHLRFVDIDLCELQVASFLFLRNPLARSASEYYYCVDEGLRGPGSYSCRNGRKDQWQFSIQECLQMPKWNRTCGFEKHIGLYNMLTGFVCGFGGPCDCVGYHAIPCDDSRLREAVERGKYNLQYKFQTFGVVENWDLSMALLEHTFPKLKGLGEVEVVTERKTKRHLGLPEGEQDAEFRRILWPDLEIWSFAKDLLLKRSACLPTKEPADVS